MNKHTFLNAVEDTQKNEITLSIDKNSFKDKGDGVISFPNGMTITDTTEQHNGTKYDIKSMDISEYKGKITVDHADSVEKIVATAQGVKKGPGRVFIEGLKFAVQESPLARFVYNMMKGGWVTDFSIETMGPWPDDEGVYYNSRLVGLSIVTVGNNKSASIINKIAKQSVEEAKKDGLDTTVFESEYLADSTEESVTTNTQTQENTMKFVIVKNSKKFAVTLKYQNSAGDETEVIVQPGASVEVPEDQAKDVKSQVDGAEAPKTEEKPEVKEEKKKEESVADAVKNAMAPFMEKVTKMEKAQFDNSASEPMFKKAEKIRNSAEFTAASQELGGMDWRELHGLQINSAWEYLKQGSDQGRRKLETINKYNLEKLQEAGKASNAMTISDFGNFVISPELLTDIEGFRSDFKALISRLNFKDTLSLQMAWLVRDGDVNMQEVENCDDGANGNLKPVSEYEADFNISNLKEVAAVTPVCNAATRFLAVDMLADIAGGYRTDFDRKRAQLFIARLQQAVNTTGQSYTYSTTSDVNALKSFFDVAANMQEDVMNGVYILSHKSYWELMKRSAGAGINTDSGFQVFSKGENGPLLLGAPFIIVPNELLPTLNTAETKSFVVEGVTVTINKAVFYVDLNTFAGRTSGGLMYDLSTEAAYEVNSVVKSAYQRNELVLRGSFFRGGAVKNVNKVTALGSAGVS